MTDAGWAVIGGISGGIIGATAGGLVDFLLGSLRERKLAKAGARLVAGDISMAGSRLQHARSEGKWWAYYEFPTANWEEYRGVLAVALTNNEFESVSQAVVVLKEIFEKIPVSPQWPEGAGFMVFEKPHTLNTPIQESADAYNALVKLAGHQPVVGRAIHKDQLSDTEGSKSPAE